MFLSPSITDRVTLNKHGSEGGKEEEEDIGLDEQVRFVIFPKMRRTHGSSD